MMRRLSPSRQRGQMLVGVMVLLAIVFLLGSAMALGVSGSLHQVDQGAGQDAARYAAESAVARGQAAVQSASPPTADSCGPLAGVGSLNSQFMQAQACYITAVDGGAGNVRYSSHSEAVLASDRCLSVRLNGGPVQNGSDSNNTGTDNDGDDKDNNQDNKQNRTERDGRVWSTVAWRSISSSPADLTVFVDDETDCQLTGPQDDLCRATDPTGPIYVHCAYHMDPEKNYFLKVINLGGPASVSGFTVRDAAAGHDCVATVIGRSQAATDEGDLILPAVVPASNPPTCGFAGARLGLRNRLLP